MSPGLTKKEEQCELFWKEVDEKFFQGYPKLLVEAIVRECSNESSGVGGVEDLVENEEARPVVEAQGFMRLERRKLDKCEGLSSPWETFSCYEVLDRLLSGDVEVEQVERLLSKYHDDPLGGEGLEGGDAMVSSLLGLPLEEQLTLENPMEANGVESAKEEEKGPRVDSKEEMLMRGGRDGCNSAKEGVEVVGGLRLMLTFPSKGFHLKNYTARFQEELKSVEDWKGFLKKMLGYHDGQEKTHEWKMKGSGLFPGIVLGPQRLGGLKSRERGETFWMDQMPGWRGGKEKGGERMDEVCGEDDGRHVFLGELKREEMFLAQQLKETQKKKYEVLSQVKEAVERRRPLWSREYWSRIEEAMMDLYRYQVYHGLSPGHYAYNLYRQTSDLDFLRVLCIANHTGLPGWWTEDGLCSVCGSGLAYDEDPVVFCDGCFSPAHHGCVGYPVVTVSPECIPSFTLLESVEVGDEAAKGWPKLQSHVAKRWSGKTNQASWKGKSSGVEKTTNDDWFCDACHLVLQQVPNRDVALVIIRHVCGPRTPEEFNHVLVHERSHELPERFTYDLPVVLNGDSGPTTTEGFLDPKHSWATCCSWSPQRINQENHQGDAQENTPPRAQLSGQSDISFTSPPPVCHVPGYGGWSRWVVRVCEKKDMSERLEIQAKEAESCDAGEQSQQKESRLDQRWSFASSSRCGDDAAHYVVALPHCGLCGYDAYCKGGGIIKKIKPCRKQVEFCHIRCVIAVGGSLRPEFAQYDAQRVTSKRRCQGCQQRGPGVVPCRVPDCSVAYHMPCATQRRDCFTDFVDMRPVFYCPDHARTNLPVQSLRRYKFFMERKAKQKSSNGSSANRGKDPSLHLTHVSWSIYRFLCGEQQKVLSTSHSEVASCWTARLWKLVGFTWGNSLKTRVVYQPDYLACVGWNSIQHAFLDAALKLYVYLMHKFPDQVLWPSVLHILAASQANPTPPHSLHIPSTLQLQCVLCWRPQDNKPVEGPRILRCRVCQCCICSRCLLTNTPDVLSNQPTQRDPANPNLHNRPQDLGEQTFLSSPKQDLDQQPNALVDKAHVSFLCPRCATDPPDKSGVSCQLCCRRDGYLIQHPLPSGSTVWVHLLCRDWFLKESVPGRSKVPIPKDSSTPGLPQLGGGCAFCSLPFGFLCHCDTVDCHQVFHVSCCYLWNCMLNVRKTSDSVHCFSYCLLHQRSRVEEDSTFPGHAVRQRFGSWGVSSLTSSCWLNTQDPEQMSLALILNFLAGIVPPSAPLLYDKNAPLFSMSHASLEEKAMQTLSEKDSHYATTRSFFPLKTEKPLCLLQHVVTHLSCAAQIILFRRLLLRTPRRFLDIPQLSSLDNSADLVPCDAHFLEALDESRRRLGFENTPRVLKRCANTFAFHLLSQFFDDPHKRSPLAQLLILPRTTKRLGPMEAITLPPPRRRGRPRKSLPHNKRHATQKPSPSPPPQPSLPPLPPQHPPRVAQDDTTSPLSRRRRRRPLMTHTTWPQHYSLKDSFHYYYQPMLNFFPFPYTTFASNYPFPFPSPQASYQPTQFNNPPYFRRDDPSTMASGGYSTMASGGYSTMASGGYSTMASGGYSTMASGGHSTMASGGPSTMSSGGHSTMASGGQSTMASGGHSTMASGGHSTMASGGHSTMASGGHSTMASGGPSTMASGGHSTMASGGHSTMASGGHSTMASGGPSTMASGGPSTVSFGGHSTMASGGPSTMASGGPSTVSFGGPSTMASGRPSTVTFGDACGSNQNMVPPCNGGCTFSSQFFGEGRFSGSCDHTNVFWSHYFNLTDPFYSFTPWRMMHPPAPRGGGRGNEYIRTPLYFPPFFH